MESVNRLVGACGVLALLVGGACSEAARADSPDVRSTSVDLGLLQRTDRVLAGEFTVRNDSRSPFHVAELFTSCGCVKVTRFDADVPAGGEMNVGFEFNPRGMSGEVTQQVYVRFSDGFAREVARISAVVMPAAYAEPALVELRDGRPVETIIRVPGPASSVAVESRPPSVRVSVEPLGGTSAYRSFRARLTRDAAGAGERSKVTFSAVSGSESWNIDVSIRAPVAIDESDRLVLVPVEDEVGRLYEVWGVTGAISEPLELEGPGRNAFDVALRDGRLFLVRREPALAGALTDTWIITGDGRRLTLDIVPVEVDR